jgi:hypothetical protein
MAKDLTVLKAMKEPREVLVEMNVKGSWRSLGCFDLDHCDIDFVLDAAEVLVLNHKGAAGIGKLRITTSCALKVALMYWCQAKGWEDSRHVVRQ